MIVVPLAADCEELRRDLIERELPPVAALEPAEARRLSREGNLAVAAAWQPTIDTLPVDVTEVAGVDGAAASVPMRRYVPRPDPRPETPLAWRHRGGMGVAHRADPRVARPPRSEPWRLESLFLSGPPGSARGGAVALAPARQRRQPPRPWSPVPIAA